MELSEDSIKRKQYGDFLGQYVNVQIKSELEECRFESNHTEDSVSDSYCSHNIKIDDHNMLQYDISNPFPFITMQGVKTEIKKELDEHNLEVNHGCNTFFKTTDTEKLDSEGVVKLQIGDSFEIDHAKHCTSTKTTKLLSKIDKEKSSLLDSYCSDNIKIEEHMLQFDVINPFPVITMQEVKTEIKKELDEPNLEVNHECDAVLKSIDTEKLDSEGDVKLQIGDSFDIDHETAELLSKIDKKSKF
uniref:Uncharacterized protein LOC114348409 n=1 Tax=Diabrotica virgifera virgifera TaxID=50390 RepID=A0A6P7H891_DIAVI